MAESQDIRIRVARYVREAIFELLDLDADTIQRLLNDPFSKPIGHWPLVKYLRGTLISEGDDLARAGCTYPSMEWKTTIKSCVVKKNGEIDLKIDESLTANLGDGVTFEPKSVEVWEPH